MFDRGICSFLSFGVSPSGAYGFSGWSCCGFEFWMRHCDLDFRGFDMYVHGKNVHTNLIIYIYIYIHMYAYRRVLLYVCMYLCVP